MRYRVLRLLSILFRLIGWLSLIFAGIAFLVVLFNAGYAPDKAAQLGLLFGVVVSSLVTIALGEAAAVLLAIADKVLNPAWPTSASAPLPEALPAPQSPAADRPPARA